ncbi:hypothetical protein WISP_85078 [Willisornis vidua]|uniref:TR10A factor n=1 Tax=Willisornis vidua TaxID=1566151 RepID=A0ABQ9D3C5_9PASS|nr:hypothetical protein WISP_85078 [Willisornis vidua]
MLRMTTRLCHPLLLLLAAAAFGTDAAALNRMNYSDPLNSSRTKRDVYNVCPLGTYFAKYCEDPEGCSSCLPCKDNEYMDRPNYGDSCYECLKCREDQVEQSPCQPTRNRECVCKEGTFCDPNQPCEMCQKCRSQCPEGQEVLSPCRPDKDTQCGPATNISSFSYHWIILIMALLGVALLACCVWKCPCCCPALRDTFYIFAEHLHFDYWCKFGRSLGMGINDLPQQRDNEELYKMLQKWHQKVGSDASVNMLLETLDQLDLRGVADFISDELRSKGWNEATEEASDGHAVP